MSDTARDRAEFTPTTKQVRDGYRYDPEAEYHDPITPHHVHNGRAFDRWLAAELAAAKAEALREAAQIVEDAAKLHSHPTHEVAAEALRIAGWRLRLRADKVERTP